jgi:hypothetical protein
MKREEIYKVRPCIDFTILCMNIIKLVYKIWFDSEQMKRQKPNICNSMYM